MVRLLDVVCGIVLLATTATSALAAETWTVGGGSSSGRSYQTSYTAWFEFENGVLDFKGLATTYSEISGTSTSAWNEQARQHLSTCGTWAVCGTVSSNQLVADPYASFVATSDHSGFITWAPNTPTGYVAPLMVGAKFEGFGGNRRPDTPRGIDNLLSADTTLAWAAFSTSDVVSVGYIVDPGSHTFYATAPASVPEPASILTLLAGVGSVAGVAIRRRR